MAANRWQFVAFTGTGGRESRGIVDLTAISHAGGTLHQKPRPRVAPTGTVCCFTHLADLIAKINACWKERWAMAEPGFCFRGADDVDFDLNPSLLRSPYPLGHEELALCENNLWTEFRLRSKPLMGHQVRTAWEALLIMQHHGFPTRLLDWSRSLAVAAYFAVRDIESKRDGCVWAMAARHLMELRGIKGPWRTVVGDPALEPLKLREGVDGLEEFCKQTPMALSPDHLVPRIVAQHSIYTMHSFEKDALERLSNDDRNTHRDACFLHRIVVPADTKRGFRSELAIVAGVSEGALFPDLDGFARDFASEWKRKESGEIGPGAGPTLPIDSVHDVEIRHLYPPPDQPSD